MNKKKTWEKEIKDKIKLLDDKEKVWDERINKPRECSKCEKKDKKIKDITDGYRTAMVELNKEKDKEIKELKEKLNTCLDEHTELITKAINLRIEKDKTLDKVEKIIEKRLNENANYKSIGFHRKENIGSLLRYKFPNDTDFFVKVWEVKRLLEFLLKELRGIK